MIRCAADLCQQGKTPCTRAECTLRTANGGMAFDMGYECALPHIEPPASEPKSMGLIAWVFVVLTALATFFVSAGAAVLVASVWGRA